MHCSLKAHISQYSTKALQAATAEFWLPFATTKMQHGTESDMLKPLSLRTMLIASLKCTSIVTFGFIAASGWMTSRLQMAAAVALEDALQISGPSANVENVVQQIAETNQELSHVESVSEEPNRGSGELSLNIGKVLHDVSRDVGARRVTIRKLTREPVIVDLRDEDNEAVLRDGNEVGGFDIETFPRLRDGAELEMLFSDGTRVPACVVSTKAGHAGLNRIGEAIIAKAA